MTPPKVGMESLRRGGDGTDATSKPRRRDPGGADMEHSRPSSSGGRLEQHLGAVESSSVDPSSASTLDPKTTIPASPGVIYPSSGPRIITTAVVAAGVFSSMTTKTEDASGRGGGGTKSLGGQGDNSGSKRALQGVSGGAGGGGGGGGPGGGPGGSTGAGFGSSASRDLVDEPQVVMTLSDATQKQHAAVGRKARDRRASGGGSNRRRASADLVLSGQAATGTDSSAKGGAGRGKVEAGRTRARRAVSHVSFSSSLAAEGGGGGGGGDDRGRESGAELGARGGRRPSEKDTEDHKFRMQAGQSNTLVAVRLRPLLKHDREHVEVAKVLDHRVVVLMDPAKVNQEVDPLRVNRTREKRYAFDYVFDETATQRTVYENTTKFLIQGVLDGFNATVFAYGCTGAGKTYTMIGNGQKGHQGIMVLTLQDLFKQQRRASETQGRRYSVTVSFLEVYNENIRDLLNDTGEFLDLREDPIKGPTVSGLAEVEARTPEEIMGLLHQGNLNRTQQATRANAVSSRSHAVLQVVVESRDKAPGTVARMHIGKLSLVDLAGSERAAATQNRGVRLVEGANINRSLLALGNCINALGERGNKGQFVPYRDSKLTRLLKDSLGGNCRTVMIANISGASSSFEETLNTLKYANRAKNIKTNATRNSLDVNHHISEYVNLIGSLRTEITRLKHQLTRGPKERGSGSGGGGTPVRPEAMVFSPSLKTNPNSLFAADRGEQPAKAARIKSGTRKEEEDDEEDEEDDMVSSRSSRRGSSAFGGGTPSSALTLDVGLTIDASSPPAEPGRVSSAQDKDFVEEVREKIVENFRERMQLRRSLIELEDQNVQNSIEVGKRQLLLVEWHGGKRLPHDAASDALQGRARNGGWAESVAAAAEAATGWGGKAGGDAPPPPSEVRVAWRECEQLCSAISKNNETKRRISRRLRNNGRQAERFKADLDGKITGEDRDQLMKLQYRIGKLELDNMELEQSRIVHDSAMRGKDLTIQKLQLQLAVRDRTIALQQATLEEHGLDSCKGFTDVAGVDQVGITDSLDVLLPNGVVDRSNGVRSGGATGGKGDIGGGARNNSTKNSSNGNNRFVVDRGGGAVGAGVEGRRGGWGSSSDNDTVKSEGFSKRGSEGLEDDCMDGAIGDDSSVDCGGGSQGENGSGSSPSRAPMRATVGAGAAREVRQQEGGRVEHKSIDAIGGTKTVPTARPWPKRRSSNATARARHPSSSQQQQQHPHQSTAIAPRRRRLFPTDSTGASDREGDQNNDDSIGEDNIVVSSSVSSAHLGRGGAVSVVGAAATESSDGGGGGIGGAGTVQLNARHSNGGGAGATSDFVAPFHGPVPSFPSSFSFCPRVGENVGGGTNNATPTTVAAARGGGRDNGANDGGDDDSDGARGRDHESSIGLGAVVGITVKQQPCKGFHRRPPRDSTAVAAVGSAAVDFSTTTLDINGRAAATVRGGGNSRKTAGGDNSESGADDGAGDDPDISKIAVDTTGTSAAAVTAAAGGRTTAGRVAEGGGSFRYPSEQRRTSRIEPTATTAGSVAGKDHYAQPPSPVELGLETKAPLAPTATGANAETVASTVASSIPVGRAGSGGGYSMGISGTGMALPWRDRRQGPIPVAATSASTIGRASGAGVTRRRLRRKQIRAANAPAGVGCGSGGGGDGGGGDGSGWGWVTSGSNSTNGTAANGSSSSVGTTLHQTTAPVVPREWEGSRTLTQNSGRGDKIIRVDGAPTAGQAAKQVAAATEDMVVVASSVGGIGGGWAARSSSTIGGGQASAGVGGSLTNLKARMRDNGGGGGGGSSIIGGAGRSGQQHIPHQTF